VVREARDEGLKVFVCAGTPEIRKVLERLDDIARPGISFCDSRRDALIRAVRETEAAAPSGAPIVEHRVHRIRR
jgi:hypothetical protein